MRPNGNAYHVASLGQFIAEEAQPNKGMQATALPLRCSAAPDA